MTVLLYDQTCAAEKKRRRKRGTMVDPAVHVRINEEVCEGCGDCSAVSNCLAIEPVETEFGRKRRVQPSACNKDLSCLQGFCPSFVTVEGGSLRRRGQERAAAPAVPPVDPPGLPPGRAYGILVAGVGGTGVVTIGQLLGMAAHLEGLGISVLDVAGLAQKGGAVHSFVQVAGTQEELHATRIATGEADLVLGCDLVVAAGAEVLSRVQPGRTRALLSGSESPTAAFVGNPDWRLDVPGLVQPIREAVGDEASLVLVDAIAFAERVLGDAIFANAFVLGAAWQKGWIPLRRESLLRAIELNASAVATNLLAFEWGRAAAADPKSLREAIEATLPQEPARPRAESLEEVVGIRARRLVKYQDEALARRYRDLVGAVREAETRVAGSPGPVSDAVARNYYRLLAVKDEFEVARMLSDPAFTERLGAEFEGRWRVHYHLAPTWLARPGKNGEPARKVKFGPWLRLPLRALAAMRGLRGTLLDPFRWSHERVVERALVADYEATVREIVDRLAPGNRDAAARLAEAPAAIRGYGHVKERSISATRPGWARMREDWTRAP